MIDYIENINSTHLHVINKIKNEQIKPPYILYANNQYEGVGSRGSEWLGYSGNLYLSFCVYEKNLPCDIPSPSISIYFACLVHEFLSDLGSLVWLKWPNDFYINCEKIGGLITAKVKDIYIVSMGMNLIVAPKEFGVLDIKLTNHEFVKLFEKQVLKNYSWKKVFSKFKIQFHKNKDFTCHHNGKLISLKDAVLCDDGSLQIDNKKVYSLR